MALDHTKLERSFHTLPLDATPEEIAAARATYPHRGVFTVPEEIDVLGMPVKPRRFTAKLSYRGKPFASVPIEVSTVEAGNADQFDTLTSDALGLVGVPAAVAVPCMTIPWQIAQKLHAVTAVLEAPRVNDRAHDLVDLQLLEGLLPDTDLLPTRSACIAVFEARAQIRGRRKSPRCRTDRRSTRVR
jgi:Nucleotidyl transferase AbiEii toxin, Type IV TA system